MIAFTWCELSNWLLILLYNPASSPSFTDYPTKGEKFEKKPNTIASKKSLKKIYLANIFQQSSKISEMHRTLNNYILFSQFLFYTQISNIKYVSCVKRTICNASIHDLLSGL